MWERSRFQLIPPAQRRSLIELRVAPIFPHGYAKRWHLTKNSPALPGPSPCPAEVPAIASMSNGSCNDLHAVEAPVGPVNKRPRAADRGHSYRGPGQIEGEAFGLREPDDVCDTDRPGSPDVTYWPSPLCPRFPGLPSSQRTPKRQRRRCRHPRRLRSSPPASLPCRRSAR